MNYSSSADSAVILTHAPHDATLSACVFRLGENFSPSPPALTSVAVGGGGGKQLSQNLAKEEKSKLKNSWGPVARKWLLACCTQAYYNPNNYLSKKITILNIEGLDQSFGSLSPWICFKKDLLDPKPGGNRIKLLKIYVNPSLISRNGHCLLYYPYPLDPGPNGACSDLDQDLHYIIMYADPNSNYFTEKHWMAA